MRRCWLVNLSGRPGKWISLDEAQEHIVRHIKVGKPALHFFDFISLHSGYICCSRPKRNMGLCRENLASNTNTMRSQGSC
jgi:hypothetical protein